MFHKRNKKPTEYNMGHSAARNNNKTHKKLALGINRPVNDAFGGVDQAPRVVAQEAAPPRALHAAALLAAHEAPEGRPVLVDGNGDGLEVLGGKPDLWWWWRTEYTYIYMRKKEQNRGDGSNVVSFILFFYFIL